MVKLKTTDAEVDPCFECRLCETRAYDANNKRELDPATGQALCWVNQCFCANCNSALTLGYASELAPGGKFAGKPLALIKHIKSTLTEEHDFQAKKAHFNTTVSMAAALDVPDTGVGSHIFVDTAEDAW